MSSLETASPEALRPLEHAKAVSATFTSGITRPLAWRRAQLKALNTMMRECRGEFCAAVKTDLGKPGVEAFTTELMVLHMEIADTLLHLSAWTRPERVGTPALIAPARGRIVREPLGTVLIIAPWNYPVHLALMPLIGAIAAGNAVILKPSELAPATSAALAKLLPRYLDSRAIRVVEGAVDETTELLTYPWDHIFYTGNGNVGRIVARAAAEHLTPITLELGGKSPVFIDETADLEAVATWLTWGKYLNAGQTCVAPDYVLTTPEIQEKLVAQMRRAITRFFGTDPAASADYGRMVNERHLQRVLGLLGSGAIAIGGDSNPADRYIAPTVLTDVSLDDPIMAEEIFGPVLPIVTVSGRDEAIAIINGRDKPLALYVFSRERATHAAFTEQTSSGALVFNSVILQLTASRLPFGGVGPSGMGAYHGELSVATFSHAKPILKKANRKPGFAMSMAMPPYSNLAKRLFGGGK